ncbi:amino acid ABC transporter substrate-binding protein, partial [Lacrimispora saccharolytica]|nr:amino acid ABC transporter substrate-binding protein [Lacrimispora saccharolytica]
ENPNTTEALKEVIEDSYKRLIAPAIEREIDCIMGCFSMEGRLDDYRWAGPYIASRQVVAVYESSDIYKLSDLEGKNLAVHSTTIPEVIFLNRTDERIP